jgi:Ran GTPase-activating protein (RanGAP) involved in mRNA processing and transport
MAELTVELLQDIGNNKPTLTKLDLRTSQIDDEGAKALAKALENNQVLIELDLWGNQIGDEGAKALAKALENNQVLTKLGLWDNQIGDEGAKALAKALENNQVLTELILWGKDIGDEGAKAFAKALENKQVFTKLYLRADQIGAEGAKALAKALENNQVLTELILWGKDIGDEGAKALAKALENKQTLTTLYLRANQIGDEGAKALAKALENKLALAKLGLLDNQIGDEGAKALAKALENKLALAKLGLLDNQIGDEGAKALAQTLENNQALTELHLGTNQIGDEGAKALAKALENKLALAKLGLLDNQIGDEGAKALAQTLENNQALTELHLGTNQIGDEGAKALAKALENNQVLIELDLRDNQIGDEGAKALAKALEHNQALAKLNLNQNNISDNILVLIEERLTHNRQQQFIHAAQTGDMATVQDLMNQGVSIDYCLEGKTALDYAREGGHDTIVHLLEDTLENQSLLEDTLENQSLLEDTLENQSQPNQYFSNINNQIGLIVGAFIFIVYYRRFITTMLRQGLKIGREILDKLKELKSKPNRLTEPEDRTSTPTQYTETVARGIAQQIKLPEHRQDEITHEMSCLATLISLEEKERTEEKQDISSDEKTIVNLWKKVEDIESRMNSFVFHESWFAKVWRKYITEYLEARKFEQEQKALQNKYSELLRKCDSRIDELDKNQRVLAKSLCLFIEQNELKRKQSELHKQIKEYPECWIFFSELHSRLQSYFLAIQVLKSDKFESIKTKEQQILATMEHIFGGITEPVVNISFAILKKLADYDAENQKKREISILNKNLFTSDWIDSLTQHIAWIFLRYYELQIRMLTDESAKTFAIYVFVCLTKAFEAWDTLCSGDKKINFDNRYSGFEPALIEITLQNVRKKLKQAGLEVKPQLTTYLRKKGRFGIVNEHGWTEEGVLLRTAIETEDGEFFLLDDEKDERRKSRPSKYGFRLGTCRGNNTDSIEEITEFAADAVLPPPFKGIVRVFRDMKSAWGADIADRKQKIDSELVELRHDLKKMGDLQREIGTLEKQKELLMKKVTDLQNEMDTLKEGNESLNKQEKSLTQQVTNLKNEMVTLKEESECLKEQVVALQENGKKRKGKVKDEIQELTAMARGFPFLAQVEQVEVEDSKSIAESVEASSRSEQSGARSDQASVGRLGIFRRNDPEDTEFNAPNERLINTFHATSS